MKMMNKILLVAIALLALTACDNEKAPKSSVANQVVIDATDHAHFIYFSFKNGKTMKLTDEEASKSMDWDIAFRANYPRTNGGTSGKGQGAVIKTEMFDFDNIVSVPQEGQWTEDSMIKIPMVDENGHFIMPPKYEEVSGNKVLKTWLASGGRPPHKYDNSIFLVKTAAGEIAKVQLLSYEKDGKSGYITMRYEYPFHLKKK